MELKHKETLQASLAIQNLKWACFSSTPYPYQASELNIPGNLQEVLTDLQDIHHHPSQVWNFEEIGFDPKIICIKMVCTYKLSMVIIIFRSHTDERSPF